MTLMMEMVSDLVSRRLDIPNLEQWSLSQLHI